MLGVAGLEYLGMVEVGESFPPYRAGQLVWAENLLGGILFGIGMTLASGCGNKTLVRIGGGNLKSVLVLAVIAVIAYFMVNPFRAAIRPCLRCCFTAGYGRWPSISVRAGSGCSGGRWRGRAHRTFGDPVACWAWCYWGWCSKSSDSPESPSIIFSAGWWLVWSVVGAWYLTSNVLIDLDGEPYTLRSYTQQWDFLADSPEGQPADSRPLSPQSFTFINPMGQTLGYAMQRLQPA